MIFVPLIIVGAIGLAILLRPWPLYMTPGESQPSDQLPNEGNIALGFGKWVERQARARGLSVRGVARQVPVECPKCRKESNYFVYPDELCERCWRATLKPISTPVNSNHV